MKMPCLYALHFAKRPLIAFGAGVRDAQEEARLLLRLLNVPHVVTWGARDIFLDAIGAFGTHGTKAANLAVQNCDWLLTIGTRLDTKATGAPASDFAPLAHRWMVDIDQTEIDKFAHLDLKIDGVREDAKRFLSEAISMVEAVHWHDGGWGDFPDWNVRCAEWKRDNPPGPGRPYEIMCELGDYLRPDDTVVSDTGCVVAWAMQALKLPCRFIHAWNMTPMGYGLPAAIGAAFATGKRVILLTGDGGLNVNITEFATAVKHNLPIKTMLFNNRGHAMCRQTQRVWLAGEYAATGERDLATPNFKAITRAYGLRTCEFMESLMRSTGPAFLEFQIDYDQGVSPQVKFGDRLA